MVRAAPVSHDIRLSGPLRAVQTLVVGHVESRTDRRSREMDVQVVGEFGAGLLGTDLDVRVAGERATGSVMDVDLAVVGGGMTGFLAGIALVANDHPQTLPPAEPPPMRPPAEPPPRKSTRWRVPLQSVPSCSVPLSTAELTAVERAVRIAGRFRRVLRPTARRHRSGATSVSAVQNLLFRASAAAAETFGMRAAQEWADGFTFSEVTRTTDAKLFAHVGFDFVKLCEAKRASTAHDRLTEERVRRSLTLENFGDDFRRMLRIATRFFANYSALKRHQIFCPALYHHPYVENTRLKCQMLSTSCWVNNGTRGRSSFCLLSWCAGIFRGFIFLSNTG